MTLRLVLEASPAPQAEMERVFDGGRLVIGRSDDADWQLEDPNMFVSRRHCILTEENGQVMATDASSGGLFIDNSSSPVGTGNTVPVEPGMRLHLGDFVLRLEAASASMPDAPPPAIEADKTSLGFSFEFGEGVPEQKPLERPADLPDPFGLSRDDAPQDRHKEVPRAPRPLDQEDPFGLDLRSPFEGDDSADPARDDKVLSFSDKGDSPGGYFGGATPVAKKAPADDKPDIFGNWGGAKSKDGASPMLQTPPTGGGDADKLRPVLNTPPDPTADDTSSAGMSMFENFNLPPDLPPVSEVPLPEQRATATPQPSVPKGATDPGEYFLNPPEDAITAHPLNMEQPGPTVPPIAVKPVPTAPTPDMPPSPAPKRNPQASDDDLRAALLRGMGLDPDNLPTNDPAAEMELMGRCMRDMVEGVMLLLRTRAQEKQKVRVAQTIIASADVNPLKFLATPEDACASLLKPRGKGYLAPEKAVRGAFRDLADHQVRTWSALQTALRRMVDTFDPSEIEKEMADIGMLESLIAGGRSAKLWQLYQERYRDIAESAEKRFLGDVGADFRDAYENKRSEDNDF